MEINFKTKTRKDNDQPYAEAVSLRFKIALIDLLNSFYQASNISQFYNGGSSSNIEDLAHVASLAETARTAKAEIDRLVRDYAIVYDSKRIKIAPMHEYVLNTEDRLWGRRRVA